MEEAAGTVAEAADRFQRHLVPVPDLDGAVQLEPELLVHLLRGGRRGEQGQGQGKKDGAHGIPVLEAGATPAYRATIAATCIPRTRMKFFADTADTAEIRDLAE